MAIYSESEINSAINDILAGLSVRFAAKKWAIPRTTLRRRLEDGFTRAQAHEHQQRLSKAEEERVRRWIVSQELLGYAPTHRQLRYIASQILQGRKDLEPLGRSWVNQFLSRQEGLGVKIGKRIASARLNGANPENINRFFNNYDSVSWIKPENTWNADEAGIMEGYGLNSLVIGSDEGSRKYTVLKGNQERAWVTLVEAISAVGETLTPCVVFKGEAVQQQWFKDNFNEKWLFAISQNGWISNALALEWLQRVFIPETAPTDPSEARLLIVDGHGSHATPEFMWECFQNNIFLLFLPAHTSHVLQPLDLGVFSALKAAYRRHLERLDEMLDSTTIGKANFLECYAKARKEALTAKNIKSGFRATGIYPLNRRKVLLSSQVIATAKAPSTPQKPAQKDKYDLQTPRNGLQVVDTMRYLCPASPCTRRLLTRYSYKAARTIDSLSVQLVLKDRELEAQKALNERLSHKKRRAVEPDKNEIFCSLAQIKDVQGGLDELRRKRQRVRKPRTSNDDNTDTAIIVATS
ncbi:unnamed protein product [Clonostachys rosea f. rosea IK726]|uniref:Uncharacterized protein n=1 Tax=Clonostachys rosea f. rosea IK726 TaxID=1349383 RepID=A0ACA9UD30_BIOOC|nr:unnamed protein product [Clonostachys rosea f. rosea IK726]